MARHENGHAGEQTNGGDLAVCRSRRHLAGDPPPLAPGLSVCAACRDVVEDALIELPALFELCAHVLDLRPNGVRERVSGHRPRGIILRDAVVSVRSEMLGVLAAWCGLVTAERGVPSPDELAIRKLVGFLGIHLQWLCEHPAAADLVDELTDLTTAANEAMRPDTGFRVAVGTCLHPGCGRAVYAEAHREGAEPYEVSCEAGHVWAPEHWLALRGKQNGINGNGNPNGHANGKGHANGHSNRNGHSNGNGKANGGGNGHLNGRRSPFAEGAE